MCVCVCVRVCVCVWVCVCVCVCPSLSRPQSCTKLATRVARPALSSFYVVYYYNTSCHVGSCHAVYYCNYGKRTVAKIGYCLSKNSITIQLNHIPAAAMFDGWFSFLKRTKLAMAAKKAPFTRTR